MVDDNYRYWREKGLGWHAEYLRRKTFIPYYHIQELLIATVAELAAPTSVLEFGCGVGRHLSYLHRIPGVEARGYDQSLTMVAEMSAWAPPGFIEKHVTIGDPVARLPFADGSFDIVFTCEVLARVRAEHVTEILMELLRVSRGLVFHIEPEPTSPLLTSDHDGCWGHDLPAIYRRLGEQPKAMPQLFGSQVLTVVERPGPGGLRTEDVWPGNVVSGLYRNVEQVLSRTIDAAVADGALGVDWQLGLDAARSTGRLAGLRRSVLVEALESAWRDLGAAREHGATLQSRLATAERETRHFREYRRYVEQYGAEEDRVPDRTRRLRALWMGKTRHITIEVIDPNPLSRGRQVWLRQARREAGAAAVPWSLLSLPEGWTLAAGPACTEDQALLGTQGELHLPDGEAPQLSFVRNPLSGRARITWRRHSGIVDLYSETTRGMTVDLPAFFSKAADERVA
jgi:SAM-dependent methyltransferase